MIYLWDNSVIFQWINKLIEFSALQYQSPVAAKTCKVNVWFLEANGKIGARGWRVELGGCACYPEHKGAFEKLKSSLFHLFFKI